MDDKVLWIWLVEQMKYAGSKISEIMTHIDDIAEIYEKTDFSDMTFLTKEQKRALSDKNTEQANKIIRRTNDIGADILTYTSPDYPDMLRKTDDPPYVLYIKGEIMKWDRLLPIAVVGTRQYTDYGLNAAWAICTGLARSGVTIVSGMARGLDSVASAAAIKAGCKTIAVVGCGLDIVYPPENAELMEKIINNGAVISEYPPSSPPIGSHFPARNRIISGMSRGTLVIQAPLKSGALITANYALDSGKDVFAVPGDINCAHSRGTNRLIKMGAKLVESSADILDEYTSELSLLKSPGKSLEFEYEYEPSIKEKRKVNSKAAEKSKNTEDKINNEKTVSMEDERYSDLDGDERKIIEQLISRNMYIDDIQRSADIAVDKLATKLTLLEMKGLIVQMPGKLFRINI